VSFRTTTTYLPRNIRSPLCQSSFLMARRGLSAPGNDQEWKPGVDKEIQHILIDLRRWRMLAPLWKWCLCLSVSKNHCMPVSSCMFQELPGTPACSLPMPFSWLSGSHTECSGTTSQANPVSPSYQSTVELMIFKQDLSDQPKDDIQHNIGS
jgi:hypothetical protein